MLAVNGYNEPRDVVKDFLEKQKLKQPVLLQGRDVATQSYGVQGFPTRFWISKEGKVLSHAVGFGPGSGRDLKLTAEKLLKGESGK